MTPDSADFKQGMRMLAAGVTVITSSHDGRQSGLTATAVCSLSAEPPRLLACVNLKGLTYQLIAASRRMVVNVLAHEHRPLARRFAGLDHLGEPLFTHAGWADARGVPLLADALAAFECAVDEMLVMRTHAVLVGTVTDVTVCGGDPLLYADGAFGTLARMPQHVD